MRPHQATGRVYRRCGCRDQQKHQLGTHCPLLNTDPKHGTRTFAVEFPATQTGGHNRTVRRGGSPTQDDARTALHRYLAGRSIGISADPNQTARGPPHPMARRTKTTTQTQSAGRARRRVGSA